MHVDIKKAPLLAAVTAASRLIPAKTPVPVLTALKLEAADSRLLVAATDLEAGIIVAVTDCEVQTDGTAVIPASTFAGFLRHVPDGDVTLTTSGNDLHLSAGAVKSVFHGFDADEYPYLAVPEGEPTITLAGSTFREVLEQTVYSAATDTSRQIFTGVHWDVGAHALAVVATDVHRLALRTLRGENDMPPTKATIPANVLKELPRLFAGDEKVDITLTSHQAVFRAGNITVFCRLIQGDYPDYNRMIPEAEPVCTVSLDSGELLDSIKRVAAVAAKVPIATITADAAGVRVRGQSDVGEVDEMVTGAVTGEIELHLNAKYLIEAVGVFGGPIEVSMFGQFSPVVIKPQRLESDAMAMVLPIRVG